MRWRRTAWATLAGTLAAVAVLCWPHRPAWRVPLMPGERPLGFAGDAVLSEWHAGGQFGLRLRDVASGQLGQRVIFAADETTPDRCRLAVSPDGRRAVVLNDAAVTWALYDARTGERRTPFLAMTTTYQGVRFSSDSRWFILQSSSMSRHQPVPQVRDAATGELVIAFRPQVPKIDPPQLTFRDDGGALAVSWDLMSATHGIVIEGGSGILPPVKPVVIELYECPGFVDAQVVELSTDIGAAVDHWSGTVLSFDSTRIDQVGRVVRYLYSIDLAAPIAAPQMIAQVSPRDAWFQTARGNGWAVEVARTPRQWTPFDPTLTWAARCVGIQFPKREGTERRTRMVDARTRAVRLEWPRGLPSDVAARPDGRWLLAWDNEHGIELWSTVPPWPRWPFALLAGLAMGGAICWGSNWWATCRRCGHGSTR